MWGQPPSAVPPGRKPGGAPTQDLRPGLNYAAAPRLTRKGFGRPFFSELCPLHGRVRVLLCKFGQDLFQAGLGHILHFVSHAQAWLV